MGDIASTATTLTCPVCKAVFRVKPSELHKRKYCSKACRGKGETAEALAANTRACVVCGTPVYRPPSHWERTPEKFYCSHKCHGLANRGAANPSYVDGRLANCAVCGTQFQKAHSRNKCCSLKCAGLAARLPPRSCPECGVSFKPRSHLHVYCVRSCANAAHSKRVRGSGNGRYVHGEDATPYPPGWTHTHREMVRKRDGHRCRVCGMTEAEHGKKMHVHHIDYVKDNLDPTNLITTCRFCHGGMHGGVEQRRYWTARLSQILRAA